MLGDGRLTTYAIGCFRLQIQSVVTSGAWPKGELRARPSGPLVNSGGQDNFSRSHEHSTPRRACQRRSNDAQAFAPCVTRLESESYAGTYASEFLKPLPFVQEQKFTRNAAVTDIEQFPLSYPPYSILLTEFLCH